MQLLGVSSLLIASKYEEIVPMSEATCVWLTGNTYSLQELKEMELDIQKVLDSNMGHPTVNFSSVYRILRNFLILLEQFRRSKLFPEYMTLCKTYINVGQRDVTGADPRLRFLADYLAELSLLDYVCVQFLPSAVAASVLFLRLILNPTTNPWTSKLQEKTGYRPSELTKCIQALHDLQLRKRLSSFTTIREKYEQDMFMHVSALVPPKEIPASYFADG